MTDSSIRLARGTPADIEEIMAIERRPGFEGLVGRWPADRHEAEMAKPGSLYLVSRGEDGLQGFAMLQDLGSVDDAAYLKRIAVHSPGAGAGAKLIEAMLDWLFTGEGVNRLALHVFPENERAQRVYLRAGFEVEGLCRDRFKRPDGSYRAALQMAVLRSDWLESHSKPRKTQAPQG
jgi:RimJ/RimL family protein N-acetyltransferase